jgi:hypothetical protein
MPLGVKALDPETPYHVYEFVCGGKVFYVGHTWSDKRSRGRWDYVKNLVEHEQRNTLSERKRVELNRKSNRVIAALIAGSHTQFKVRNSWCGKGKTSAAAAEKRCIADRLAEGCLLANKHHNPEGRSVEDILRYLAAINPGQRASSHSAAPTPPTADAAS